MLVGSCGVINLNSRREFIAIVKQILCLLLKNCELGSK